MLQKICLFIVIFSLGFSVKNLEGTETHKILFDPFKKKVHVDPELEAYLLPPKHPLNLKLKTLFTDYRMFESENHFKKAGFTVKSGHRKLMVGAHPKIKGYLIKKFQNSMPFPTQMENFILRIEGANKIRSFIKNHHCVHLIVPQKWLYELPLKFAQYPAKKNYVLIVEDMDIVDDLENPNSEVLKFYYNMSAEMLIEHITILHELNGCDAMARNQPCTKSGKIAFVDTEHCGKLKGHVVKHVIPLLNEKNQKLAIKVWNRLVTEKHARENN